MKPGEFTKGGKQSYNYLPHKFLSPPEFTIILSMLTLTDYPGVSSTQPQSPTLLYESPNLPDKIKARKMHLSDIFWQILGIFGENVFDI